MDNVFFLKKKCTKKTSPATDTALHSKQNNKSLFLTTAFLMLIYFVRYNN